jgi:hypothetical protein
MLEKLSSLRNQAFSEHSRERRDRLHPASGQLLEIDEYQQFPPGLLIISHTGTWWPDQEAKWITEGATRHTQRAPEDAFLHSENGCARTVIIWIWHRVRS